MSEIIEKYNSSEELSLKERIKIKNRRQYLLRKKAGKLQLKNKYTTSKSEELPEPTGKRGKPTNRYTKDEFIKLLEDNKILRQQFL